MGKEEGTRHERTEGERGRRKEEEGWKGGRDRERVLLFVSLFLFVCFLVFLFCFVLWFG